MAPSNSLPDTQSVGGTSLRKRQCAAPLLHDDFLGQSSRCILGFEVTVALVAVSADAVVAGVVEDGDSMKFDAPSADGPVVLQMQIEYLDSLHNYYYSRLENRLRRLAPEGTIRILGAKMRIHGEAAGFHKGESSLGASSFVVVGDDGGMEAIS